MCVFGVVIASPGAASAALVQKWLDYIQLVMKQNEPVTTTTVGKGKNKKPVTQTVDNIKKQPERVSILYERALAQCFLVPELWQAYIHFLTTYSPKSLTAIVNVYKRAVR